MQLFGKHAQTGRTDALTNSSWRVSAVPLGLLYRNNERFSQDVRALVRPGMDIPLAINRLEGNGFECDPRSSAPAITCVKTRQGVLPYTCIERVNLMSSNSPARCNGPRLKTGMLAFDAVFGSN